MQKTIGVITDDGVEYHAVSHGYNDYDTLCGIDANDAAIGHYGTFTPDKGQKITCAACKSIYFGTLALKLKKTDFK